jgi:hypothetical protein
MLKVFLNKTGPAVRLATLSRSPFSATNEQPPEGGEGTPKTAPN